MLALSGECHPATLAGWPFPELWNCSTESPWLPCTTLCWLGSCVHGWNLLCRWGIKEQQHSLAANLHPLHPAEKVVGNKHSPQQCQCFFPFFNSCVFGFILKFCVVKKVLTWKIPLKQWNQIFVGLFISPFLTIAPSIVYTSQHYELDSVTLDTFSWYSKISIL